MTLESCILIILLAPCTLYKIYLIKEVFNVKILGISTKKRVDNIFYVLKFHFI